VVVLEFLHRGGGGGHSILVGAGQRGPSVFFSAAHEAAQKAKAGNAAWEAPVRGLEDGIELETVETVLSILDMKIYCVPHVSSHGVAWSCALLDLRQLPC